MRVAMADRMRACVRALTSREARASDTALLLGIAAVSFLGHLLVAGNYGYFRDELYYIVAGRHLAWGYVDFPPMIALIAALLNVLAGDSLVVIHVVTALAAACLIVVTGLMARELGGRRLAQGLAALGAAVAVVYMATGSLFTYDVFDELWWGLAAYVVIRLLKHDEPRLWLVFGLVAGVGLFTKLTMLCFGFALTIGLLATPARKYFLDWLLWAGGAIAFAFLVPYALWNAATGWPTPEFWAHYSGLSGGGPLDFVFNQLLTMNPFTAPLWLAGLYFYLRAPAGKPYRVLGWAYVALVALFVALHVKPYFLSPIYSMLLAAGGVAFEQASHLVRRAWVRPAYAVLLVASGLFFAPLSMPVLPPTTFASTYGVLTFLGNSGAGQHTQGVFPQYLGDRFGWDTLAAQVERGYRALPADEQAEACVLTDNYGEAGALEMYRAQDHLPPVISGHNSYYFWGPGSCTGAVLITVGIGYRELSANFASVTLASTTSCTYCMASEDGVPIYVAIGPKGILREAWPRIKHFN